MGLTHNALWGGLWPLGSGHKLVPTDMASVSQRWKKGSLVLSVCSIHALGQTHWIWENYKVVPATASSGSSRLLGLGAMKGIET